jgi:hypothetical protein
LLSQDLLVEPFSVDRLEFLRIRECNAIFSNCGDSVFRRPGMPYFSRDDEVQRRSDRSGHFGRDNDAATGNCKYDGILSTITAQGIRELPSRVSPIGKYIVQFGAHRWYANPRPATIALFCSHWETVRIDMRLVSTILSPNTKSLIRGVAHM